MRSGVSRKLYEDRKMARLKGIVMSKGNRKYYILKLYAFSQTFRNLFDTTERAQALKNLNILPGPRLL